MTLLQEGKIPWASTLDTDCVESGSPEVQPFVDVESLSNFISRSQPHFLSAVGGGNFLLHLPWKTRVNHNVSQPQHKRKACVFLAASRCSWVRESLRQRAGRWWGNRSSRHWEGQGEHCLGEFSLSPHHWEVVLAAGGLTCPYSFSSHKRSRDWQCKKCQCVKNSVMKGTWLWPGLVLKAVCLEDSVTHGTVLPSHPNPSKAVLKP